MGGVGSRESMNGSEMTGGGGSPAKIPIEELKEQQSSNIELLNNIIADIEERDQLQFQNNETEGDVEQQFAE